MRIGSVPRAATHCLNFARPRDLPCQASSHTVSLLNSLDRREITILEPQASSSSALERFQILSLDGGGIRSVFSAAILAAVELDLNVGLTDTST